jgi:thiol-disulfide isomerase/thioredoxin
MRSNDLLETLIDAGVLEPSDSGDSFSLSAGFLAAVADAEDALAGGSSIESALDERFDDGTVVEALASLDGVDRQFVATYCALADRFEALAHDDLVRTVAVLRQLQGEAPRTEGAPDQFLPVHGERLSALLPLTQRGIVYVWREDCEPCDLVRETLEDLLEEDADDVALFAVYGPDAAEYLYEHYDVGGAPTTLFVVDGEVDSRLQGAHYSESYAGEIETIRERAA